MSGDRPRFSAPVLHQPLPPSGGGIGGDSNPSPPLGEDLSSSSSSLSSSAVARFAVLFAEASHKKRVTWFEGTLLITSASSRLFATDEKFKGRAGGGGGRGCRGYGTNNNNNRAGSNASQFVATAKHPIENPNNKTTVASSRMPGVKSGRPSAAGDADDDEEDDGNPRRFSLLVAARSGRLVAGADEMPFGSTHKLQIITVLDNPFFDPPTPPTPPPSRGQPHAPTAAAVAPRAAARPLHAPVIHHTPLHTQRPVSTTTTAGAPFPHRTTSHAPYRAATVATATATAPVASAPPQPPAEASFIPPWLQARIGQAKAAGPAPVASTHHAAAVTAAAAAAASPLAALPSSPYRQPCGDATTSSTKGGVLLSKCNPFPHPSHSHPSGRVEEESYYGGDDGGGAAYATVAPPSQPPHPSIQPPSPPVPAAAVGEAKGWGLQPCTLLVPSGGRHAAMEAAPLTSNGGGEGDGAAIASSALAQVFGRRPPKTKQTQQLQPKHCPLLEEGVGSGAAMQSPNCPELF